MIINIKNEIDGWIILILGIIFISIMYLSLNNIVTEDREEQHNKIMIAKNLSEKQIKDNMSITEKQKIIEFNCGTYIDRTDWNVECKRILSENLIK